MKNVKNILESGLIESYMTGLCTEKERIEMEGYIEKYPEVKKAIFDYNEAIEKMASENAMIPPSRIKERLMNDIIGEAIPTKDKSISDSSSMFSFAKLAATFLVFATAAYFLWNQSSEIKNLKSELAILEKDCEEKERINQQNVADLYLIKHHQTQTVKIAGDSFKTDTEVYVFWNQNFDHAILDIERLPEIDENHVFQIWADKDGEMISRGIFTRTDDLVKIDFLKDAESLNITIEPTGGSKHPTVSRLIANGLIV